MGVYCFPVLIFCLYLHLKLCLAREFTCCHIRNVIRLALSDVSSGGRVFGVRADLRSLVLVGCCCAYAYLFPNNGKTVTMLAIRCTIETLAVS